MNVKAQYIGDSAIVKHENSLGVFRHLGTAMYIEMYDPFTGWENRPVQFDTPLKIVKSSHDTSREWVEEHSQAMPDVL